MLAEWTVLNLGYFSRNRYWGESDDRRYRDARCTSTLVRSGGHILLVDPCATGDTMTQLLDHRCGLRPEQVDTIYMTHGHRDHFVGAGDFPWARLLAAPGDFELIRRELSPEAATCLEPAGDDVAPGVRLLPLPGHTEGLAGLYFRARQGTVVIAGDAVVTEDFFRDRRGYYNSTDMARSSASIDEIAGMAQVVVPGHDNYFYTAY